MDCSMSSFRKGACLLRSNFSVKMMLRQLQNLHLPPKKDQSGLHPYKVASAKTLLGGAFVTVFV